MPNRIEVNTRELYYFLEREYEYQSLREILADTANYSRYLLIGGVFFLKSLVLKTSSQKKETDGANITDIDLAVLMVCFLLG